jgi:histone deacetylase HOS3
MNQAVARSTTPKPEAGYQNATAQSARRLSLASNASTTASTHTLPAHNRIPSGTSGIPQRPGSSIAIRPESSMSSRSLATVPSAAVNIKKTRAASVKRGDAPKTGRGRGKPPASGRTGLGGDGAADVNGTRYTIPNMQDSGSNTFAEPQQPLPITNTSGVSTASGSGSDVDKLTSGMGKIRLSLTTKRQREERERAKLAAQIHSEYNTTPTSNTSVNDTELEVTASTNAQQKSTTPTGTPPITEKSPEPVTPLPDHPNEASTTSFPTTPFANTSTLVAETPTKQDENIFIPYEPEVFTPQPIQSAPQVGNITWLPPNTSTPGPISPAKREEEAEKDTSAEGKVEMELPRRELPVFTSTSAIPFGPPPTAPTAESIVAETPKADDKVNLDKPDDKPNDKIWEIPESPLPAR